MDIASVRLSLTQIFENNEKKMEIIHTPVVGFEPTILR